MDDPFVAARGDKVFCELALALATLWSTTLGFQLQWPKGSAGVSVQWVGSRIEVVDDPSAA